MKTIRGSCRLNAVALAAITLVTLLSGCAGPAPALTAWRVEPTHRIEHTGPSAAPGYVALARQFEGERRWREASDAWRKASLEAPDDAEVLNSLGTAEAGQSRYREAIAALRRAVALAPERAQFLNNLGFALILDGLPDEAIALFRQALAHDPSHAMARVNLARAEQAVQARAPAAVPLSPSGMTASDRLVALGLSARGSTTVSDGAAAEMSRGNSLSTSAVDLRLRTEPNVPAWQGAAADIGKLPGDPALPTAPPADVASLGTPRPIPESPPQERAPSYSVGFGPVPSSRSSTLPTLSADRVGFTPVSSPPKPAADEARPAVRSGGVDASLPEAASVDKPVPLKASPVATRSMAPRAASMARMRPMMMTNTSVQAEGISAPRIEISNGNGVNGMAARLEAQLRSSRFAHRAVLTNAASFTVPTTTIYYRPGFEAAAKALAERVAHRLEIAAAPAGMTGDVDLRIVLGRNARVESACTRDCVIADSPAAEGLARARRASLDAPDRPSALVAAWLTELQQRARKIG